MWTGLFAFITIFGTWYGAQLKTERDAAKVSRGQSASFRLRRGGRLGATRAAQNDG